jgi:1,4-alpha-glucan branching enzyme
MEQLNVAEGQKILIFHRGPLVFVFNFNAQQSFTDYRFGVPQACDYRLALNTDHPDFGGFGSVAEGQQYPIQPQEMHGRKQSVQIYVPARTAQVLAPVD